MIPLSYSLIHWSCAACGENEFGSRVFGAVLGTLIVPLAFLSLEGWKGVRHRPGGLGIAGIVAGTESFRANKRGSILSRGSFPFRRSWSGAGRAATFHRRGGRRLLPGARRHLLPRRSRRPLGDHLRRGSRGRLGGCRPISPRLIFVFLAGGLCIAGVLAAYVWPLMRDWNPGAKWGYSTAHSILGSVNMVGWPVFLLAVLGGANCWRGRRGEDWYWGVCALGWGAVVLALPRPGSLRPGLLVSLRLEHRRAGRVRHRPLLRVLPGAGRMGGSNRRGAVVPGESAQSRQPLCGRFAARHADRRPLRRKELAARRSRGRLFHGLFGHYAPHCDPRIPLPADARETLESLAAGKGRLWIVLPAPRRIERRLASLAGHALLARTDGATQTVRFSRVHG